MIPRLVPSALLAAALAAALAACGQSDGSASSQPATPAMPAAATPAAARSVSVPTQAELEAKAAKAIDRTNADQELAKLKAELGGS